MRVKLPGLLARCEPRHQGVRALGLVELARIQTARGNRDQARNTLDRALSGLENADPEYKLLREAKGLLAELGG